MIRGINLHNNHCALEIDDALWQKFGEQESLSEQQLDQFKRYFFLLCSWNEKFNLTTITKQSSVIRDHFQDSLALGKFFDLTTIKALADVGTGAGFPGVALKIKYPALRVYLLEVNTKKVQFLNMLIEQLALDGIEVIDLDWRTFLRKSGYAIDLFVARASLQPEELLRIFSPHWGHADAQLVYWASDTWVPRGNERDLLYKKESYQLGQKQRKLVFFKKKESH